MKAFGIAGLVFRLRQDDLLEMTHSPADGIWIEGSSSSTPTTDSTSTGRARIPIAIGKRAPTRSNFACGVRWALMKELRDALNPALDDLLARLEPCDSSW